MVVFDRGFAGLWLPVNGIHFYPGRDLRAFITIAALVELSKGKDFWIGILGRSILGLTVAALFTIGVVGIQAWIMGGVGLGASSARRSRLRHWWTLIRVR